MNQNYRSVQGMYRSESDWYMGKPIVIWGRPAGRTKVLGGTPPKRKRRRGKTAGSKIIIICFR